MFPSKLQPALQHHRLLDEQFQSLRSSLRPRKIGSRCALLEKVRNINGTQLSKMRFVLHAAHREKEVPQSSLYVLSWPLPMGVPQLPEDLFQPQALHPCSKEFDRRNLYRSNPATPGKARQQGKPLGIEDRSRELSQIAFSSDLSFPCGVSAPDWRSNCDKSAPETHPFKLGKN